MVVGLSQAHSVCLAKASKTNKRHAISFRALHNSMLGTLLRVHGPLRRSAQHVLVRSNHTPSANAIDQLEKDSARILRAVQKRVETRKELLSKASREAGVSALTHTQRKDLGCHVVPARHCARASRQGVGASTRRVDVVGENERGPLHLCEARDASCRT
jgi:hypothetical protein